MAEPIIKPLLLAVLAYWLNLAFIESRFFKRASDKLEMLNRIWVRHAVLFFVFAAVIMILFGELNMKMVLPLALISLFFYALNRWVMNKKDRTGLAHFLTMQVVHLVVLYTVLWLAGQAEGPSGLGEQFHILFFADELQVDKELIVPAIALIVLFLTVIAPEIVDRTLGRFRNPAASANMEIAAAIEHKSEAIRSLKDSLIHRFASDAVIEEQFEESLEGPSSKTIESVKVQYQWYRKEDDSSKGKAIGILERLLVVVFVYYGVYQGLVLLGAMKTLARFKMFESKTFAEYYLIGTLLSLLLATACGFLMRRIV